MEIVEYSEITNELAIIEEDVDDDDELYEGIQAPKFVDFTVPDRSRPDDRSWFCARVGCDQQHEEIDHDALHKSFILRVMAARSPNVKLQRASNRQNPRLNCPCSAPAKSARDRVSRPSTLASDPDKSAKSRLAKDHPVSSLRSTPKKAKVASQPPAASLSNKKALTTPRTRRTADNHEPFRSVKHQKNADERVAKALFLQTPKTTDSEARDGTKKMPTRSNNKALTTPRTRKCPDDPEPFRSAKHQKAPVNAPKKKTAAKALFLQTPTVSEVRDGVNKLNIGSPIDPELVLLEGVRDEPISNVEESLKLTMEVSEGSSLAGRASRGGEATGAGVVDDVRGSDENKENASSGCTSNMNSTTTIETCENIPQKDEPSSNVEESLKLTMEVPPTCKDPNTQCDYSKEVSEGSSLAGRASGGGEATGAGVVDGVRGSDENKENASGCTSNLNSSTTIETCENVPQKDVQVQSKIVHRQCAQGGKPKRTTTNPKPFRLRTDERGILKEANLERRLKLEARKETSSEQQNEQAAPADLQTGASKEEPSRARPACFKRVRFVESRYANIKPKCQKPENKNGAPESENNSVKMASSRPIKTKSSEAARTMPVVSQLRKTGILTKDAQTENKPTLNPACSKGRRRPAAVAKAPASSRLHLPKSCATRPTMAVS